jgi:hypothetical protein
MCPYGHHEDLGKLWAHQASRQLLVQAVLQPLKEPLIPTKYENEWVLELPRIKQQFPGCPGHSLVTVLTTLLQFIKLQTFSVYFHSSLPRWNTLGHFCLKETLAHVIAL